jgi:hypothetical protein
MEKAAKAWLHIRARLYTKKGRLLHSGRRLFNRISVIKKIIH